MTPPHLRLVRNLLRALARQDPAFHSKPWDELGRAVERELAEAVEMGECVFRWRVPLSVSTIALKGKNAGKKLTMQLCPLLNVYASLPVWMRARLYKELDVRILGEMPRWPHCRLTSPVRRGVRVTRYSSNEPDEWSVDVFAKVHIDRLVLAGVLAGDKKEHVFRVPRWERASPGKGSTLVEVFDLL